MSWPTRRHASGFELALARPHRQAMASGPRPKSSQPSIEWLARRTVRAAMSAFRAVGTCGPVAAVSRPLRPDEFANAEGPRAHRACSHLARVVASCGGRFAQRIASTSGKAPCRERRINPSIACAPDPRGPFQTPRCHRNLYYTPPRPGLFGRAPSSCWAQILPSVAMADPAWHDRRRGKSGEACRWIWILSAWLATRPEPLSFREGIHKPLARLVKQERDGKTTPQVSARALGCKKGTKSSPPPGRKKSPLDRG